MDSRSVQALSQAYDLILQGNPAMAKELLDESLMHDLGNRDIIVTIKFCTFWAALYMGLPGALPFEQGEILLSHWDKFLSLIEQNTPAPEKSVETFKESVYSHALKAFSMVDSDAEISVYAESQRKMALCYKRLGDYEAALSRITEANACLPGQAPYIAELADCYDLCGDVKKAKLLFKEAFYIDAQKVELQNLDSQLIRTLEDKVREEGYSGSLVQEWLPVYGTLTGIFNMKRPLKKQELIKLQQDIRSRKMELKDPANNKEVLTPRLMNMYLRLLDYYFLSKEDIAKIRELMLNIQLLDKDLYQKYFKIG